MDEEDKKESESEEDFEEESIEEKEEGSDEYEKEIKEENSDNNEEKMINNNNYDKKEKEMNYHNKILAGFFIAIAIILISIVSFNIFSKKLNNFEYYGYDFNILKEGDINFYHTSFVINKITESSNSNIPFKEEIDYNVYLRKDPRNLEKISFNGEINQKEMMVINISNEFNCEGKGVIAVANMAQIFGSVGTKIITDPNATCDDQGRYMFVQIQKGDKTNIEQYGPSCYNIKVKECEILEGTERFVLEMLKGFNEEPEKFELISS